MPVPGAPSGHESRFEPSPTENSRLRLCPPEWTAFARYMLARVTVGVVDVSTFYAPTPPIMRPAMPESFLKLAMGKMDMANWRQSLLYEYYWEWNFPHTPTVFALRGNRYKFIQYHGVWDIDELYDLQADPGEKNNLIHEPNQQALVSEMRQKLYQELKSTGGTQIPFGLKRSHGASLRRISGSSPADFPREFMREKDAKR